MTTAIALSLVGAFYVFAGVIAMRVGLTDRMLDEAISKLSMVPVDRVDVLRGRWNRAIAGLTFLSGLLAIARLDVALAAFAASALAQAAYLFHVAPNVLDKLDAPDPLGRHRTRNAFVIYLAATLFVGWAWTQGHLTPVVSAPWPVLALVAVLAAAYVAYALLAGRLTSRKS